MRTHVYTHSPLLSPELSTGPGTRQALRICCQMHKWWGLRESIGCRALALFLASGECLQILALNNDVIIFPVGLVQKIPLNHKCSSYWGWPRGARFGVNYRSSLEENTNVHTHRTVQTQAGLPMWRECLPFISCQHLPALDRAAGTQPRRGGPEDPLCPQAQTLFTCFLQRGGCRCWQRSI